MYPNVLATDVATARYRDLLADAQRQRRAYLTSRGRSVEMTVRAAARRVLQLRVIREISEPAAA
ncbi:MAG: hypothetical protein M3Q03_08845 [Chloroflexota bacterium]|nr:hypothetical protein [Chloroflexota bacterium]